MSSMSQDIIQRGGTDSELESLTGYILRLARRNRVKAPYNEAVYELGKELSANRASRHGRAGRLGEGAGKALIHGSGARRRQGR